MPPRPLPTLLFAIACGAVAWLCLTPAETLPPVSLWDKIEHALAYLGLTLFGVWAFPRRLTRLATGLFCGGVAIEILQTLMGWGRQGDPADALANTVGIAAGLLLTLAIRERIKVKSPARGE
ncbi:MAG TPA: hypothetical protein PLO65_16270 [Caulobacter sp.]|nr:hypothetical protein [Caulobacter sp.]